MRVGIADHLGWAVVVTASSGHEVVDRRWIELLGAGMPVAPIHHEGGTWHQHVSRQLDDTGLAALIAEVRTSALRATAASLEALAADLPGPIESISLRAWPDLPEDIAVLRRPPYESRADAIMYRRVLAEVAAAQGWRIHLYDSTVVVRHAVALLGDRAEEVLDGPRTRLGPPWTKDHRTALAATIAGT